MALQQQYAHLLRHRQQEYDVAKAALDACRYQLMLPRVPSLEEDAEAQVAR